METGLLTRENPWGVMDQHDSQGLGVVGLEAVYQELHRRIFLSRITCE